ncbi:hypothetical protein NDU88_003424 [Pleurodeles waltl]|uniref:Uncharacterized protein n=1 Tax=Pleurodeles waltl TaxID=8319 RepID=A0AAV7V0I6_PLEWA|nr:hypothetical protein NDU88_003424 [Pleurodeles waltl]
MDKTQLKLQFDLWKAPGVQDEEAASLGDGGKESGTEVDTDLKHTLEAVQQSLTKIDTLTFRMDRMSERLYKRSEPLDMVEWRVSEAEDEQVTVTAAQKQLDKLLLTLQAKEEDLEAHSRRNNLSHHFHRPEGTAAIPEARVAQGGHIANPMGRTLM